MSALKEKVKEFLFQTILFKSLVYSEKQSGLVLLVKKLYEIVPDITRQYSTMKFDLKDKYLNQKIRNLHAFQVRLLIKAVKQISKNEICIADIGDSSGAHVKYIQNMSSELNCKIDAISVNLDPIAVEKIQKQGLKAILCRAEDLHKSSSFQADIFSAFEVLEHFFDPISFLKKMSSEAKCNRFVITVPYMKTSRVGLQFIKNNILEKRYAENTHIFELNPTDWDLIFKFSGWKISYRETYLQYPKWHMFFLTKILWRRFDFEGFYGVILEKDETYSRVYQNW